MSRTDYSKRGGTIRFGEWLRQLRKRKGLRLREVAAGLGVDQAILSKCELGQRTPNEDLTKQLAKFYHVAEREMQIQRIAEEFRQKHEGDPRAREAVYVLAEQADWKRGKSPTER